MRKTKMGKNPRICLLWEQFAPYHVDRIEAVGARFSGRAKVIAIEVATTSETYNWPPSSNIDQATKLTLFPGQSYEDVGLLRRFWAQLRAALGGRMVFVGIGYDRYDIIALSWLLRLTGTRVIMMTDSKFDDRSRWVLREALKSIVLKAYSAAIVAGRQQRAFVRLLGHHRHQIVPGYDTVSIDRLRREAALATPPPVAEWPFTFVGRFVPKKNILTLIDAYARYVHQTEGTPRRLQLIGSGALEAQIRDRCNEHGISHLVDFPGFLSSSEVSPRLAASLALILISVEEQWGLVVNEAVALGVPVIVSTAVGSADALVRNLCNGFIFEPDAIAGIANAMALLAERPELRDQMSAAALDRAWLADSERFADAVEYIVDGSEHSASVAAVARFERSLAETA